MWIFFYIFFILTSTVILPIANLNDIWWIPKECIFNILGFSFIASSWLSSHSKSITFKNRWLALILIHCVISFGWYFYFPVIFNNPRGKIIWNLWLIRPFINITLGLWIIQTLVEFTDNLQRWVNIVKCLCWTAFVYSIYTIIQYLGIDPIFNNLTLHYQGNIQGLSLLGNSTLTGNFIAMLSPLCLMFKNLRYKIIYIICFIGILLTGSSLSLIAFIIGLLSYLILTKKYRIAILIIILGVIFAFIKGKAFFTFSGRFEIWKNIFSYCKDTIWMGKGLGNFAFNQYRPFEYLKVLKAASAHCEPLQILHDGGLIMLSLVIAYLIDLFRRMFSTKVNMLFIGFTSAFITYLIISLGNFPLRIAPLALVGIIYIAGLEVILIKGEQNG